MWNLDNITLLPRLRLLAHCHCHHCCRHGRRCCFLPSCLSPYTLRINCHHLIFFWVSRRCRICHRFRLLGIDFGAAFTFEDAFDFDFIGLGAFEYKIYLVSFLLSVCFGNGNATEGSVNLTTYFTRRMLRSHVGIGIS
jgi:hypothetical protein